MLPTSSARKALSSASENVVILGLRVVLVCVGKLSNRSLSALRSADSVVVGGGFGVVVVVVVVVVDVDVDDGTNSKR